MFFTYDFSADVDFSAVSSTSLFFSGASGVDCVSIFIQDDSIVEQNETFSVLLTSSNSAIELSPSSATITIIDDDTVVIGWSSVSFDFDESGTFAIVCAEIMEGVIDRRISVFFSTVDDTTQGNQF